MDTFLQAFRNLGPRYLTMMGILVLAMLGFLVFFVTQLAVPKMTLLYGDLDIEDSGRIVQQLETANIPYELRANGTQILVPKDQVLRQRMALANQGLPAGGSMGYELFDNTDTLGTTNFIQNVNLVRALEGELARTIRSLAPVKAARVHLVLPKRELFSRERQEPSASIILKLRGGGTLVRSQVEAIQHLVATAVPALVPQHVSVVDDKGNLLAKGYEDENDTGPLSAKAEERRRAYEARTARTIETLLEKTVGVGKVRAEVSADMDFDRISTSEETYDPDGQVVRSTQTIEENNNARENEAEPPVSVATNLPDTGGAGGDTASSQTSESRTEETVNFEISKKVISHVRESGVVRRLSVAVVVDGMYAPNQDGETVYQERPQEEMNKLLALVKSAIGFNQDRGDTIEVVNMPFTTVTQDVEEELELFFGLGKQDLISMAETLVLGILVVLVTLLVFRPLVQNFLQQRAALATAGEGGPGLLADQSHGAPALTAPGARGGVPAPGEVVPEDEFEELIDIDRVEGRVKASSVKKVGEIVDKHPEEALSIIRSWMYQEA